MAGASHSDHAVVESLREARSGVSKKLRIVLALALAVLAVEIVGGFVTNSLALFADAGHVAGDAVAVALALGAIWLTSRPGGGQRTFGWYRAEIIAAMLNGGALLVIAGVIVWRAVERIGADPEIAGGELLGFAAGGLLINIASVVILREGQRDNLNVRGAYYHVVSDTLGSVGALIAGIVVLASGWVPVDLIVSMAIAVLIVASAVRLLRETMDVLLEAAPAGMEVESVGAEVCRVAGVVGVHDLHLWTVTSGFPALSCHLEIEEEASAEEVLVRVTLRLRERFDLHHVTLQPESLALHNAMACCEFPDQSAAYGAERQEAVASKS
ncbi:MAG: cation diffusion facilitator family transporter [Dehalococcoidia bacterium]